MAGDRASIDLLRPLPVLPCTTVVFGLTLRMIDYPEYCPNPYRTNKSKDSSEVFVPLRGGR